MKIELEQVKQQLIVSETFFPTSEYVNFRQIIMTGSLFKYFYCLLKNETSRIRADNKLDINLERSRVTDMVMCF